MKSAQEKLELALGALRFYADEKRWGEETFDKGQSGVGSEFTGVAADGGEWARKVLAMIEEDRP